MDQHAPAYSVPPALATPTDLGANATRDIAAALNGLLADVFALYMKTKNFHWHMSGPHFRDYHLMLDKQARRMREAHGMVDEQGDVASASLLEVFIDEAERRAWFLYETSHQAPPAA